MYITVSYFQFVFEKKFVKGGNAAHSSWVCNSRAFHCPPCLYHLFYTDQIFLPLHVSLGRSMRSSATLCCIL